MQQEVEQDVVRTFQRLDFFKQTAVKKVMTDVLVVWSLAHPSISYKQGMNDLLGIILIVVWAEQACADLSSYGEAGAVLASLNDPAYIEHDAYILFSHLIDLGMWELFLSTEEVVPGKNMSRLLTIENPIRLRYAPEDLRSSKILQICHRVFHENLKNVDRPLYEHLVEANIEPHVFLL